MVAHDDIKEVLGAELLAICIEAHPRLDQFVDLQVGEVKFDRWILVACACESREENLDVCDELVDQRLVKRVRKEGLLGPQFDNLHVLDSRQVVPMIL